MKQLIRIFILAPLMAVMLVGVVAAGPPKPDAIITPVQLAIDIPFQQHTGESQLVSYTVPDGKTLVIQFASMFARVYAGGIVVFIETTVGGVTGKHYLTMNQIWHDSYLHTSWLAGTQDVNIYSAPGTSVTVKANGLTGCDNGDCPIEAAYSGSISGYLIDSWWVH